MSAGVLGVGPCGGNCACGGCHVRIEDGGQYLSYASDLEKISWTKCFDVRRPLAWPARPASSAGGKHLGSHSWRLAATFAQRRPANR
jgi:hypothetical protein